MKELTVTNETIQKCWDSLPEIQKDAREQLVAFHERNGLPTPTKTERQIAAWIATEAAAKAIRSLIGLPQPKKVWPPDTEENAAKKKAEFSRLHPKVKVSKGIHDALTFGTGELDKDGFWEYADYEAARTWERLHPEDGECWPHTEAQIQGLKL